MSASTEVCGNTIAPVDNYGNWGACQRPLGHTPPCQEKPYDFEADRAEWIRWLMDLGVQDKAAALAVDTFVRNVLENAGAFEYEYAAPENWERHHGRIIPCASEAIAREKFEDGDADFLMRRRKAGSWEEIA